MGVYTTARVHTFLTEKKIAHGDRFIELQTRAKRQRDPPGGTPEHDPTKPPTRKQNRLSEHRVRDFLQLRLTVTLVTLISSERPVPMSRDDTCKIPPASIVKVTSI